MYTDGLVFPSILGTMSAVWGVQFEIPDENGLSIWLARIFIDTLCP